MSSDAAAVWLAYNAAENAADFAAMGSLVAADLDVTVNGRPAVASAEDDERAMRQLMVAYPDYRREVDEVLGSGDRAVARWRMVGTPASADLPRLDVSGCSVVRVEDGRIAKAHLYYQGAALDEVLRSAGAGS
jgi:ketosteroid isomerase-like protein